MTKPSNHPAHVLLVPNKISERPFGTITTDFITDLSEYEGYNVIHCVVNRLTKGVVVSPYCETINVDGTDCWKAPSDVGLWDKMISARGPQFASKAL